MRLTVRILLDELRAAAVLGTSLVVIVAIAVVVRGGAEGGAWIAGAAAGAIVFLAGISRFDGRYADPGQWPPESRPDIVRPVAARDLVSFGIALVVLVVAAVATDQVGCAILLLVALGNAGAAWSTWARVRALERRGHITLLRAVAATPKWKRAHGSVYAVSGPVPRPAGITGRRHGTDAGGEGHPAPR